MPCSSCEPFLDEFVDGTLLPGQRRKIEAHLESCIECSAVLSELRVVDALLLTPRAVEPPLNFTCKVMAEVRSVPPPHRDRTPFPQVFATYLAFSWIVIALWFTLAPGSAKASMALLHDSIAQFVTVGSALSSMVAQAIGHQVLGVTASVWGILTLDFLAAAVSAAAFFILRTQRVAHALPPERR
jgi:anti-sigma factor RsiW